MCLDIPPNHNRYNNKYPVHLAKEILRGIELVLYYS